MKELYLFTLSLLLSLTAYGRTITGLVYSDSTQTVVADAVCKLYDGDTELSRATTDKGGIFMFRTDKKSALVLEIDKNGYSGTTIMIEEGGKDVNLNAIALSEATTLSELKVESTEIQHSKGRTIVYPSQADLNASSTTLSLLQKLPLPGLFADPMNRTLKVRNGTPYILINGIPATMNDVNSLVPKDIAKIEYSYITPARYADKGDSGFLAITLKARRDGGQVYLWGRSAVNTAFVDGNLRASYHQGPSQFTLQYTPSWRNYQDVYDNILQKYIGDDFRVDIEQHDRDPFNYHTHGVGLKYDFAPTDRTIFSARIQATPMSTKNRSIGLMHDSELGDYGMRNISTSKDFTPSLDLFVRHDFNEKNSLEAQMVGTLSSSDYRRDNSYLNTDDGDKQYINDINNRRRSLISEVSYVHNFDQTMSLAAGVQNTLSHNTNDYLQSETGYKPVLTENNNYIYTRFSKQVNKVFLSASTGVKMFWTHNDQLRRHYIRNLSSVTAAWYISQKWSVQASFQYTPSIPSLSAVTDYMQQQSPYLFSNGNPDLKVADFFRYVLVGQYVYRKFSAIAMVGYFDIKNATTSDIKYLGDGKFLSQTVNTRKYNVLQSSLQLRLSGLYGFGANVRLTLSRYNSGIGQWNGHLTSLDAVLNLWWNKGPWTISYYHNFPGKELSGYSISKGENSDMLQVEFHPNKHWTIGAAWWYMFNKKGSKYPSWSYSPVNPSTGERYIKDNGNMVTLSATYTTDFGSLFKRNTRRSLNNADSNSSLLKN